ncbi:hypothetical protein BLS_006383 [Venturia inaequalis]|uniref:C2H2-type domain-containing protein n=1 Tax=Venturia inaequalis TaxID=5025 RepID=A0A8H3Z1X0_VENIN|nr:hypothetical protein BLS_006383 [Venturia inaequalis]RDI85960.1 hypothetical protein Vi05172_g4042 [Venturia inaequalis]
MAGASRKRKAVVPSNSKSKRVCRDEEDDDYEAIHHSQDEFEPEDEFEEEEVPTKQLPTSRPLSPSPDPDDIRFILRPNIYKCTFENCNRAFNRPCRLEDHIRSHTGDRPFVCQYPDCDKSFTRDSHLARHIKSAHTNVRNFACTWEGCGKAFATGQRMRGHYASHVKYKDFTCTGYAPCKEVFRKKTTLQAHIASVHLGAKPFPCDFLDPHTGETCNKGYNTQGKLNSHISKEHTGVKHTCPICDNATPTDSGISMSYDSRGGTPASTTVSMPAYTFLSHKLLQIHMETCHPLACPHCHSLRISKRDLASHIELDHPEAYVPPPSTSVLNELAEPQTYPCTYEGCTRVFTKGGNLKVHIRCVHEKSTPFVCNTTDLTTSKRLINGSGEHLPWSPEHQGCEQGFGTKAMLENHIRMRHLALGSWDSHLKRLKGVTTRGRGGGNQKKKEPTAASLLTGGAYQEEGRDLPCLKDGCPDLFFRHYDLRMHCADRHGMAEVEMEERLLERAAQEGGQFWVSEVGRETGWYDEDEDDDDYGEDEQMLDRQQNEIPIDPALEGRMEDLARYIHNGIEK